MVAALRHLTSLPVAKRDSVAPGPLGVVALPIVGLLVGLVWALVARSTDLFVNTGVGAALVLVVDALLTGARPLAGTAAVADAVVDGEGAEGEGGRRTGAAGTSAVVLLCLLRYSLLIFAVDFAWRLVAAPVAGRAAMVALLWRVPPRQDGSIAAVFGRPGPVAVAAAAAVAAVVASVASGPRGLLAVVAAAGFALAAAAWWRHRFGPLVGDAVGACGLLAETLALVVLVSRGAR